MQKLLLQFNKLPYWGIFIILIFVPLFFKFPLVGVAGSFVSVRLEDILIFLVISVWLVKVFLENEIILVLKNRIVQLLILFFFIGLVSVFSGAFLTQTITLKLGLLHFFRRVEILMLLPLVMFTIKSKRQVKSLLIISFLVLLIVNLYGLGQKFLHFPVVSTTNSTLSKGVVYFLGEGDRVSSTFSGHYDLAVYLLMATIILIPLVLFLMGKNDIKKVLNSKNILLILIFLVTAFVSMFLLIMTATRFSFAAAIFGIGLSLLILRKWKFILALIVVTVIALAYPSQLRERFISTFTVNILKSWQSYTGGTEKQIQRSVLNIPTLPNSKFIETPDEKIETEIPDITPGEPTDSTDLGVFRSFDIRIQVEWPRAVRAFTKNPFLGIGYSSIGLATDNDLLRSLGEVGILGTVAFGLLLIEVFKKLWRNFKSTDGFTKHLTAGIVCMLAAFILNSLFIDVFEASKIATLFWILIGLTLSLGRIELDEKNN